MDTQTQTPVQKPCELLPMAALEAAAECLKIMAHPVRLRIVEILMQVELPVHEIAALCELPPHQTCEHLRLLKGHGLLDSVRRGRSVYYKILNPRLPMLLGCIRSTCNQAAAGDAEGQGLSQ